MVGSCRSIFAPSQSEIIKLKCSLYDYMVDYPVYIDTAYSFEQHNMNVSESFFAIINANNEIVLSGYPFENKKIYRRYLDTIYKMFY